EDLGDMRMVHECQGLTLGLEPGEDGSRVHSRLDELEGNLALDGVDLLGEIDGTHTAFTDFLTELVAADDDGVEESGAHLATAPLSWARCAQGCGSGGWPRRGGSRRFTGRFDRPGKGRLEGARRLVVNGEQSVQAAAQVGVTANFAIEESLPLGGVGEF